MSRHRNPTTTRPARGWDPIATSLIAGILLIGAIILAGEATGGLVPAVYWPLLGAELVEVGLLVSWWTRPRRPDGAG